MNAKGADMPAADLVRAGLKLLVSLVAPTVLYYGLRAAGVGAYPALIAAAVADSFLPGMSAACGPGCSTTITCSRCTVPSPLSIRA